MIILYFSLYTSNFSIIIIIAKCIIILKEHLSDTTKILISNYFHLLFSSLLQSHEAALFFSPDTLQCLALGIFNIKSVLVNITYIH